MRSAFLLLALLVFAAPAQAGDAPASVKVLSCSPWQEGLGGTVSYESRMHSVPGAERMTVRFDLLEKAPGRAFHRVSVGAINRSRRGASTFKWQHQFDGLRQGAVYRTSVVFRWLAADGSRVRTATKLSAPCKQPGGPPNLRISGVGIGQGAVPGTALYNVTVVNRGATAATGVSVLLRVDGEILDESDPIESLAPGESQTVSFSGPVCRKKLRAVVDPKGAIAESREDDNVRTTTCV